MIAYSFILLREYSRIKFRENAKNIHNLSFFNKKNFKKKVYFWTFRRTKKIKLMLIAYARPHLPCWQRITHYCIFHWLPPTYSKHPSIWKSEYRQTYFHSFWLFKYFHFSFGWAKFVKFVTLLVLLSAYTSKLKFQ